MTQQIIDTGLVANDGTGESLRNAFIAVNNNFANVWAYGPVDTQVVISNNQISTNVTNLELRLAGNGIASITVESTVLPSIDSVYDLGSPTKQFDEIHARYYYGNGRFLTGISGGNGSGANVYFQASAPLNPEIGDIWIESDTGTQYLYFNDDTSNQWAEMEAFQSFSTNANITNAVAGSTGELQFNSAGSFGASAALNFDNFANVLTVTGNVTANYFVGNGSQLTGLPAGYANANAVAYGEAGWAGNIIPSGNNVYSLGTAANQWADLYVSNTTIYIGNVPLSVTSGNVLTIGGEPLLSNDSSTSISTTGNVTADYFAGNGSQLTGVTAASVAWSNVTGSPANVSYFTNDAGYITLGNLSVNTATPAGNGSLSYNSANGVFTFTPADASLSQYGNSNVVTLMSAFGSNAISTTGNITGGYIFGNGSQLTGLPASYSDANVATFLAAFGSNSISTTGNITGNLVAAGANRQVMYNDNGVIGGSTAFTFDENGNTLSIGTTGGTLKVADIQTPQAGVSLRLIPASGITYSYGNLWPLFANTYDTGGVSNRWQTVFANVANLVTASVSGAVSANSITLTSTGTAVNASSGNMLTNQVTGTQFNFLAGLYTVSLNASGATANYTINWPANAGANGQVLTTNGSGALSWTTPAGSYGNANVAANLAAFGSNPISTTGNITGGYIFGNGSQLTGLPATYGNANVATFLASYGSNTISTSGNVTAGNLIGNISITGNVTGTSSNVDIIAGSYQWTFNNTGNLVLPGNTFAVNYANGTAVTLDRVYLLEAYASDTYTLPGSFTEDPCRYSIVSSNVNVSSSWFNTSTYTFTPQKAGYWQITASYDVYRNAEASMVIKKNGSIVASAGSFNSVAQQITKIVYLNGSTDYINIYNYGGAALSRSQYAERSWFQARWVGE